MTEYLKALAGPFNPQKIHWRVGFRGKDNTATALAYVDARDVMDRLDEVVGPGNWQRRHMIAGDFILCEVGINIDGEWVWKADGADKTDIEATKGGLSDAFKRAAVSWGVARYLYGLETPWVKLDQTGKRILKSEYPKLQRLLGTDPSQMPPINVGRATGTPDSQRASPDDSPTPEAEGAGKPLESLRAETGNDIEFREAISHMIRGAEDVAETENIFKANREVLMAYRDKYPEDYKALMGEFARRKGDLSQKPPTEAE